MTILLALLVIPSALIFWILACPKSKLDKEIPLIVVKINGKTKVLAGENEFFFNNKKAA